MPTTQNGWVTIDSNQLDRSPIPGTNVVPVPGVRAGDVATVLLRVGQLFNARVAPLYNPGCWGWAPPTPIPGSSVYSNHGSGTAIDLNAPSFPWKLRRMTDAQRNACRGIVNELSPAVTWGGEWANVDEMHFEINADASVAQVAAVANRIRGNNTVLGANTTNQGDDDVIRKEDAHIVRIISSEVKGWDFGHVHRGETDAREIAAWAGKPWRQLIEEGWKESQSWRNKRIDALNYYDTRRAPLEARLGELQGTVDRLNADLTRMRSDEAAEDRIDSEKVAQLQEAQNKITALTIQLNEAHAKLSEMQNDKDSWQIKEPVIIAPQPSLPDVGWFTKILAKLLALTTKKA